MLVDSLTVTRMRCKEAPDEDVTVSREKFFQLSCFIDQGRNNTHTQVSPCPVSALAALGHGSFHWVTLVFSVSWLSHCCIIWAYFCSLPW